MTGEIRFHKKRSLRRKQQSNRKQIQQVKKNIREMKQKEEVKFWDVYVNPTPLNQTTALSQVLNSMALGSSPADPNAREGTSVSATSLSVKMRIYNSGTSANPVAAQHIRCMILWDRQPNGAPPLLNGNGITTDSILDTSTCSDIVLAPYNRQTSSRYRMIYDRTFVIPSGVPAVNFPLAVGDSKSQLFQLNKKFKLGRVCKYTNTAFSPPDITNMVSNSIYVYVFTNYALNDNILCTYSTRFNWKDD